MDELRKIQEEMSVVDYHRIDILQKFDERLDNISNPSNCELVRFMKKYLLEKSEHMQDKAHDELKYKDLLAKYEKLQMENEILSFKHKERSFDTNYTNNKPVRINFPFRKNITTRV